jgi:hypothetical protein
MQVDRVSYGLLLEEQLQAASSSMPEARRELAIPFEGKDLPSRAAEFANPDVQIGLTVLGYR